MGYDTNLAMQLNHSVHVEGVMQALQGTKRQIKGKIDE